MRRPERQKKCKAPVKSLPPQSANPRIEKRSTLLTLTFMTPFNPLAFIRDQTRLMPPPLLPEVLLYLATEITPLWQMTEDSLAQSNLPPPFWAVAWPGGQGMGRYVLDHPDLVRGKRVVDIASGSGIVAIAAMKAGARQALAIDIDPLALAAIKLNAEVNGVAVEACAGIPLDTAHRKADIILAGDICYQQAMSASLTRWLHLCVGADIPVLIADPGRAYVPENGLSALAQYTVPTSLDIEDQESRLVTVWQLGLPAEEGDS